MAELLLVTRLKTQVNNVDFNYEPTCFDKNIHIRLKMYEEGDVISGLESKLTFLVEYFLQLFIKEFPSYKVDFKLKDNSESIKEYIFSKYINEFKQNSAVYKLLCSELGKLINFEQILIKPVYSKKITTTKMTQFGNILDVIDENVMTKLPFNIYSITSFLLNDSLSLIISEDIADNPNEKYLNRSARKLEKQIKKANGYQENKLW